MISSLRWCPNSSQLSRWKINRRPSKWQIASKWTSSLSYVFFSQWHHEPWIWIQFEKNTIICTLGNGLQVYWPWHWDFQSWQKREHNIMLPLPIVFEGTSIKLVVEKVLPKLCATSNLISGIPVFPFSFSIYFKQSYYISLVLKLLIWILANWIKGKPKSICSHSELDLLIHCYQSYEFRMNNHQKCIHAHVQIARCTFNCSFINFFYYFPFQQLRIYKKWFICFVEALKYSILMFLPFLQLIDVSSQKIWNLFHLLCNIS